MRKVTLKGFTLVELIIVVTILSILASIWFVSYNWHTVTVRDTNRVSQMAAMHDWLEVYRTKSDLPLPENSVEVRAGSTIIAYQWYMWKNNLEIIAYNKWWIDPKDGTYFSYYVTKDRKYFQLMWFLEDQANKQIVKSYVNQAGAADYSIRFPTVYGKKLGILTEVTTNNPIQEVSSIKTDTYLDIVWTTSQYNAYYSDINVVSWTWASLAATIYNASCKRIKEIGWNQWDGLYTISPSWTTSVQVYCDMTTDWWGWTLVWRSVTWWSAWTFWYKSSRWSVTDDSQPYSLGQTSLNFSEILYGTYNSWKTFGTDVFRNSWTMWGDTTAELMTTTKVLWSCTSPFTNLLYAWHKNLTTNFFLWANATTSSTIWLLPSWFTTTAWCAWWNLTWLQWMIFVR